MIDEYLEEKTLDKFAIPHIVFPQNTNRQKGALAWHILSLKGDELLLTSAFSFSYPAIIAGISESNIEYFGRHAPGSYRVELVEALKKDYVVKEIFDIAKEMDDDLGERITKNQERVNNVIQYIHDNRAVFEF
jgi:hypothetical protein